MGFIDYAGGRGTVGYFDVDGIGHRLIPASLRGRDRERADMPGTFEGLDSELELGYVRARRLQPSADTLQEVQEVAISRPQELGIYSTNVDEGFIGTSPSHIDEGLLSEPVAFTYDESPEQIIAGIPTYQLEIVSDIFAMHENGSPVTIPLMAFRGIEHDLWVGLSNGYSHRLRIKASEAEEYFHATNITATIAYVGHQS